VRREESGEGGEAETRTTRDETQEKWLRVYLLA
jgi:hypothetical protein